MQEPFDGTIKVSHACISSLLRCVMQSKLVQSLNSYLTVMHSRVDMCTARDRWTLYKARTHTHTRTHAASASNVISEEGEDSDSSTGSGDRQPNGSVIIKPLSVLSQPPEDCQQIEPKRMYNPVMESKIHMQMHKELKLNHSR